MAGRPGRSGGANRKPTALRILEGNPGKRPLPVNEPQPEKPSRLPTPPRELSPAAKKEWRKTGGELLKLGLFTGLDIPAFAGYCETYARWLQAIEELSDGPLLIEDANGYLKPNPLIRITRDLHASYSRALLEFGMSPSSRSRVKATPAVAEKDPFDEWQKS